MLRFLFSFLILFFVANPELHALWEKEEVKDIQKKLQKNEPFFEKGNANSQILHITLEDGFYAIDLKARHCVRVIREVSVQDAEKSSQTTTLGALPIPCKMILKGYPVFKPLMPWAN